MAKELLFYATFGMMLLSVFMLGAYFEQRQSSTPIPATFALVWVLLFLRMVADKCYG